MARGIHLATGLDIIQHLGILLSGNFRHNARPEFELDPAHPFAAQYKKKIQPMVAAFEQQRIEVLQSTRKRAFIGIGLIVFGFMVPGLLAMQEINFENPLIIPLAILGILSAVVPAPAVAYKKSVKASIFPIIINAIGSGFSFDKNGGISLSSLQRSRLIPSHDHSYTEDYIKGAYKQIDLELMELRLTDERRTKRGGKQEVTIFKGLCILFSAHKPFAGITYGKTDKGVFNLFADKAKMLSEFDRVILEDPVFERQFQVYSTDQIEARYLLTPSFMTRIMALKNRLGAGSVEFSFFDNKLLLMIETSKNYFEVSSLFIPATFEADVDSIYDEMNLIFSIIDELKLNERTGL